MVWPMVDHFGIKLALKEMDQENKILLTTLSSVDDSNTREFIRSEQARIIQKRK